jgi:hypothetical protein
MEICRQCEKQSNKYRSGKPHGYLIKIDELRIFEGYNHRASKSRITSA